MKGNLKNRMDFYLDVILTKTHNKAQKTCAQRRMSDHIMALAYSAGQDVKPGKKNVRGRKWSLIQPQRRILKSKNTFLT